MRDAEGTSRYANERDREREKEGKTDGWMDRKEREGNGDMDFSVLFSIDYLLFILSIKQKKKQITERYNRTHFLFSPPKKGTNTFVHTIHKLYIYISYIHI